MDLDSAHAFELATKLYHNSLLSITSTLITLFSVLECLGHFEFKLRVD